MRALRVVALSLTLIACSHQTPDQKLLQSMGPVKSWAGSLAYMSEQWNRSHVPTSLLRNSIKAAQKELDRARKQIDESPATGSLKAKLHANVDALRDAAGALQQAVEDHDTKAATRLGTTCQQIHDALDAIERASA